MMPFGPTRLNVIFCLIISLLFLVPQISGQKSLPPGFPDRSPKLDVLPGFKNPPEGYGEVPFYWWIGDTLTRERILSQLDQLEGMSITGLQVNYCHTDKGGATYGLTYPSQPALFSSKWWELFGWFLKEAKKRGMSVSLSDYTLGAAGQGWFVDEMLNQNPDIRGSKLESKQWDVTGGQVFKITVPSDVMAVSAFQKANGTMDIKSQVDLLSSIENQELTWNTPSGDWKVILVYRNTVKTSFDPMNPLSGPKTIEKFYQRFEDHCPGESGKGLNFFFSDELQFGIRGFLWNDKFAREFKKMKGYDIQPEFPHLFSDLSPRSYKIRIDYYDVMVTLSEEGFFKPLYEWHTSRGMLFGCDHGGRGRDVTEFGDYFRTQRWMSGPGNDQPGLGRDIVKNKVASSIAHLYERPRTWLEGFYGSGWGTSSEEVADATFANFAMGHNLLSLHGLYYTTHGSWWEWAAPENHFRQPYWANMAGFLKCSERLSYVLSQGYHRCDVSIIYPVEPTQANLKGKESTGTAFAIARDLYPAGIDFDFMDFESLARCRIQDKELTVSGEKYKILILPALSAVHYSTIEKALQFFRSGGIVLAVEALPEVSDRIGGNDPQLQAMINELFGTTAQEKHDTTIVYSAKSKTGGTGMFIPRLSRVYEEISKLIQPDFRVLENGVASNILHRKVGERELYFVYGVPKGTKCFFRCSGKTALWNPWNGTTQPLQVSEVTSDGTILTLPLEKNEPQLIVFSPGKPEFSKTQTSPDKKTETLMLDGDWEFELKPTLDNKYGDYCLPAFNGKLGAELWKMKFTEETTSTPEWQKSDFNDSKWAEVKVTYGQQFWKLGPFPSTVNTLELESALSSISQVIPAKPVVVQGEKFYWQPYEFSWRWGLKDDAGHQGYHGLKGQVNNELISFGIIDKSRKHMPVYPLSPEPGGATYYLWTTVVSPVKQEVKITKGGLLPVSIWMNQASFETDKDVVELQPGINQVLLKYNGTGRGYFVFEQKIPVRNWEKPVSLATDWYLNPAVLPYNCHPLGKDKFGWYRFTTPPGSRKMWIQSVVKPEAWLGGIRIPVQPGQISPVRFADPVTPVWEATFPDSLKHSALAALRMAQSPGYYGGAAIAGPVVFECGKGRITTGDLNENGSLRTYSGGMWYRKTIHVSQNQAASGQIVLDLGKVVASAEVFINGKSVGTKIASPWKFDLSGMMKVGENRIEILIYNTLGNHYLNTPSQYIGRTNSGLIGPVSIQYSAKK